MSQTNVSTGGAGRVIERDGTGQGVSMGMITAIILGVAMLALVAWWAITQSGWFGTAYAPSTNVNVTQNQPSNPSGSTTGSTGGTGSTTGGSTTGSTGSTGSSYP